MRYKKQNYLEEIVLKHHLQLIGWPKGIPFANVSDLTGGIAVVERLVWELESGCLRFRPVLPAYAARLWVCRVTPGHCPPGPVWLGRSDIKKHRVRTVTVACHVLTGPKTPAIVSDSPASKVSGPRGEEMENELSEADTGDVEMESVLEWTNDEK